ncbi:uncharacterized protein TRIVIDRAFT_232360 [Trichoderma virens Gv29-8]|uniref:Uncharacterized protein n=1 Tax=Hypocrea virens (strain Gv29-8 / FGSC 10586) TaxID=413071 RepID=G9NA97_HYPVG|nr:uncharacterized protein TRIVIDRAFT_232360 [Trichoderma virens Gv29-8]EHK16863.1 hypothetical protein TRIVIDRAFT_232360 [Trichoderma virens Gv29-8]UKZ51761.1 hypothetical protein TrVGV298_005525 [Trichoderma virens]
MQSESLASPAEMMIVEQPQHSGGGAKDAIAQDNMSYATHEQQQYYSTSAAVYMSATYLQENKETAHENHIQSTLDDLSQTTGTNSTSLDDNWSKRDNSTGLMGIVNGLMDRVTTTVRRKDKRSIHTKRPTSSTQEPGSVPKIHEQSPDSWPHKQAETPSSQNQGEILKAYEEIKRKTDQLHEMTLHTRNLESIVHTLREDLSKADTKMAALGRAVTESEAIITQSHATAVSTLAGNVSRGITDDMIREELKKFFQNDFFSWCADLCTERIVDENAALHKLLEAGIINRTQPNAAIDWRIQTVECLEKAVPITEEYIQREVQDFVQEYEFLLSADKYDNEANKDLVQIFTDFAILALKLWKTRANIEWCDINSFQNAYFELGHPWVEVEQSLALTMGQRLNGRPIGLIVRPMIASKSLSKSGEVEEVIWHKALVWVSGENETTESEKLV